MAYIQGEYPIVSIKNCNPTCYDFTVSCPEMAALAKAGQFVHIRCGEKTLRRPISICEIDTSHGTLRLVFDIRGEGTRWLSERKAGECIDLLGPLGNGFDLRDTSKKALFVGGGIGVPPLLETAKAFSGNADAILGFKSAECALLIDDFSKVCASVSLTSDDGTLGTKGFVSTVMNEKIKENSYGAVYACGPTAMLKAVSGIAEMHRLPCYISLEERMGCGIGACLVCACKIHEDGDISYKHVCKDGPVFNAKEVVW